MGTFPGSFGKLPYLAAAFLAAAASACAEGGWTQSNNAWKWVDTRATASGPGMTLSSDWYGVTHFDGIIKSEGSAAVLVRYAGPTEGYRIIIESGKREVSIEENHFGVSHRIAVAPLGPLSPKERIQFQIRVEGHTIQAMLRAAGGSESANVQLGSGDVQIPEGRAGFESFAGETQVSGVVLRGDTQSQFHVYAFRCNYKLPSPQSREEFWQYLDELGSSLQSRLPARAEGAADVQRLQTESVIRLRRSLGLDPWPPRAPLNARITGVVKQRDYRIEKVVFESQPGFLVDALLYVPDNLKGPAPAILSAIGHYADNDFFIWSEQARSIGLARKGYVVLTYDPIGQGERRWLGNGNHDILRRKIILAGMEVSGLMFWDSMRAIDYLETRPEVDSNRIGITGVSGGGFNSLYTAVLDRRVKAAAVDGFGTSLEGLIKRADAGCCAYIPNLAEYSDIPDLYGFIAPRPLLILGGYMDVLSDRILGVYETARRFYSAFAAKSHVGYYMDPDAGHTYSKPMRLVAYRFFAKWLKGIDDPAEGREDPDSEQFLISKESGLLRVLPENEKGKDVTALMREYLARNRVAYPQPTTDNAADLQRQVRLHLMEMLGDMAKPGPPSAVSDDHATASGTVRNVVLRTERNLTEPLSIHHPEGRPRGVVIYFAMATNGIVSQDGINENVRSLLKAGYVVAAPTVRCSGSRMATRMPSIELYTMALGKHLFSTRIWDLQRAIDFLRADPAYRKLRLTLWGEGLREGPMSLYLAAIEPRIDQVVSSHGLVTFQNSVDEDGDPDFDYYVPGLLRYLDVPQMIGAAAPRRVLISAPVDIRGQAIDLKTAEQSYEWARSLYGRIGAVGNLVFVHENNFEGMLQ